MCVGALRSTATALMKFPDSLLPPHFFFLVFISLLNHLKARGFLVTNGVSQLILTAQLRRRRDARLQAEPLAAWEQSMALNRPGLSPISGGTYLPSPTSLG